MNNIVPSGDGMTGDISLDFGRRGGALYTGILRGGSYLRQLTLRTPNPFTATMMTALTDNSTQIRDQPYVSATTFDDSGTDRDRVYVGVNNFSNGTGQTASAEFSVDARTAAAPAGFTTQRIEARSTAGQDMPAVRFAVHNTGVIYGIFYRWASGSLPSAACDVIVVRDDSSATGANPFTNLTDPSDGVAGRIVAAGVTVPAFPASLGQNRLVASNLSIAVHPTNTGTVYVAWADRVGTNDYTLHVRRSTDSGATWSADLLTITNATNPALAINSSGTVGFLYQALTGTAPNQRWETHFRRTSDGTTWSDLVLANTANSTPARAFDPYIGDYAEVVAVGRTFYGIFSASNFPDLNNFPQGVTYQRNVNFTTQRLRNETNTADVAVSIDPFFFKVSPPTVVDVCVIDPGSCMFPDFGRDKIIIDWQKPIVIDLIPKNCLLKWTCPGCSPGALCPPYYHIFLDDFDPKYFSVALFGPKGRDVPHEINRVGTGLVVSFRPDRKYFASKSIGDYSLAFQRNDPSFTAKQVIAARLEMSEFPFREHMKRR
jgi:hypothetical protein